MLNLSNDIEVHPLAPFLPSHAKLLMMGSFPPPRNRWKMDFYYPNLHNDMWRIFGLVFFHDRYYFLNTDRKSFNEKRLRQFLEQTGIAISDTAYQVKRLQNNAADKFLEVIQPVDLSSLLSQLPECNHIMTTGDKATHTLIQLFSDVITTPPKIGQPIKIMWHHRCLTLSRLPSSSRAYPLPLEQKVKFYQDYFYEIGLLH